MNIIEQVHELDRQKKQALALLNTLEPGEALMVQKLVNEDGSHSLVFVVQNTAKIKPR